MATPEPVTEPSEKPRRQFCPKPWCRQRLREVNGVLTCIQCDIDHSRGPEKLPYRRAGQE